MKSEVLEFFQLFSILCEDFYTNLGRCLHNRVNYFAFHFASECGFLSKTKDMNYFKSESWGFSFLWCCYNLQKYNLINVLSLWGKLSTVKSRSYCLTSMISGFLLETLQFWQYTHFKRDTGAQSNTFPICFLAGSPFISW